MIHVSYVLEGAQHSRALLLAGSSPVKDLGNERVMVFRRVTGSVPAT
jgi:hypothetical protein